MQMHGRKCRPGFPKAKPIPITHYTNTNGNHIVHSIFKFKVCVFWFPCDSQLDWFFKAKKGTWCEKNVITQWLCEWLCVVSTAVTWVAMCGAINRLGSLGPVSISDKTYRMISWLDGVPNHRRLDFVLNRLFRRRLKKASKLRVTGFVRGIICWPVNSPHKGPVTRKIFPFDDVIMITQFLQYLINIYGIWNWINIDETSNKNNPNNCKLYISIHCQSTCLRWY